MLKLKFIYHDEPNHRVMKFETTLPDENIKYHVDAFRQFLLAVEFHPDTVRRTLGDDDASGS